MVNTGALQQFSVASEVHQPGSFRHPPDIAFHRVKLMRIELKLAELREIRKQHKRNLVEKYLVGSDTTHFKSIEFFSFFK
jgi:hypothetical protein